ncbi:MFS transporter [Geminisphaera colitermitum]|uniref:MFS transporter n=1 Tax=Geminisphaera colitermitum TaxID=1148786 RepID=UPI0005BBB23F|nr:MFS transporter [Geminisphaera colitermitum]
MSTNANLSPPRRLSLGVIFLTLYIDLIGFSIIFPLAPDLMRHYLATDGTQGVLGWLLTHLESAATVLGGSLGSSQQNHLPEVLFGGVVSSLFSLLQFVFAPFWGGLSDRRGRRGVLLFTVTGTAGSYLLWALSGSFWVFLVARLLGGAFGGNLSVATAAVADVTTRKERAKAMGIVGAAFGLGLVTGPLVGAGAAQFNLLARHPSLAEWGVNPFTMPALIALGLSVVNLLWIGARFHETLTPDARDHSVEPRTRNPIRAILGLANPAVRGVNLVAFIYALAFVAMETSLVFLGSERFGYTARQNGMVMGFLGLCSIVTQGYIVRKLLNRVSETRILSGGLILTTLGLLCTGFAPYPVFLYLGAALLATGSGLVNPSTTGLISLYSSVDEQGRVLGIYRALGALARAITPLFAGVIYYAVPGHSHTLYVLAAALAAIAWGLGRRLPQPVR